MTIPAGAVRVSANHPPEARFSVPAYEGTNGINKEHKTRWHANSVYASRLTQGRRGAYCRREYASSFWSTANRRPVRNGLALHRHLHMCARIRRERDGDLLMRAQSFHGEVNRLEARSSGCAGDGND